jgi:hypothetical protein
METCITIAAEESLPALYSQDETAWLESMALMIRRGELANLDLDNLADYLSAYENAVELAASETALPKTSFPTTCPYTVKQLLEIAVSQDDEI